MKIAYLALNLVLSLAQIDAKSVDASRYEGSHLKPSPHKRGIKRYEPLIDGKPIFIPATIELQKPPSHLTDTNIKEYELAEFKNIDDIFNSDNSNTPFRLIQSEKNGTKHQKNIEKSTTLEADWVFVEPSDTSKSTQNKLDIGKSSQKKQETKDATAFGQKQQIKIGKNKTKYSHSKKGKGKPNTVSTHGRDNKVKKTSTMHMQTNGDCSSEISDLRSKTAILTGNEQSSDFDKPSAALGEPSADLDEPSNECIAERKSEMDLKDTPSPISVNKDSPNTLPEEDLNESNPAEEPAPQVLGLKDEIKRSFSRINSFVFNPLAEPEQMFQECLTSKNESGHCRYMQHCFLPSILSSVQKVMDSVCVIDGSFIGICCPEFPMSPVRVKWPNLSGNSSTDESPAEMPEDCGVSANTRIVGGSHANKKEWPWMVALLNHQKRFYCGGSLINDRYVVTAAHCTFGQQNDRIIARVGEYDFSEDDEAPHEDYLVTEIKRHGQYRRFSLRNDIALLRLEKSVRFQESVAAICLPDPDKDYLGKMATLVGWGNVNGGAPKSSSILQEASFPIIGNSECSRTHGLQILPSIICAAATSKDKGACNGDSGGPLMLLDSDEHWKLIGLVSWGRRGCNPQFPTAYTRVTFFLDWIKKHST